MGANVTPLLLPLGIWLMMSAAAPRSREGRIAASGLLAFALAACAFFAVGFGLMFGGIGAVLDAPGLSRFVTYYTFPVAGQTWGLLGLRGFLLSDATAPEAFSLFIAYLPLVATSAMLMAGLMARRSGFIAQAVVIGLVSGIIFPIAGFWVWGGGWLAKTGLNLNLGHGVVDLGGLATAGLIAGAAGAIWLLLSPRRRRRVAPDLPANHFPFRALSGGVLVLIGGSAFVAGNPLYGSEGAAMSGAYAVNLTLAGFVAAAVALAYSFATTRRADTLCAARATLAAVIIVSAGGPLFSAGLAAALGVVAALLATVGMYVVNEALGWLDDNAVVSTAGLAGMAGLLSVGLFANGSFGAGWNGVGATSFLGQNGLGIVGVVTFGRAPADPGQFTAQLTAIGAILALTVMVFSVPAIVLRNVIGARQIAEVEEAAETPASETADRARQKEQGQLLQPAAAMQAEAEGAPQQDEPPPAIPAPATLGELPLHRPVVSAPANGNSSEPTDAVEEAEAAPARSLLERIRRGRARSDEGEKPARARHVAYPSRGPGRRVVIRPLTSEPPAQPPAAEEG